MKKLIAGILLALLVIALPVGLVGCKTKQDETIQEIEGDYTFECFDFIWNNELDPGQKNNIRASFEDYGKATINKDNTWIIYDKDGVIIDQGTWEKDEGYTYTIESNNQNSDIPFNKITIKNGVATAEIEQENLFRGVITFKRK